MRTRKEIERELEIAHSSFRDCLERLRMLQRFYPPDGGGHAYERRKEVAAARARIEQLEAELQAAEEKQNDIYRHDQFDETCRVIIPDFRQISLELMDYFSQHPERLQELEWRKFEELLEAVFRNQGFRTELGPGGGDQGVDLRLLQKDSVGEIVTLVQAKRYKPSNPIRLEAVQALYAVMEDEKANRALFITTSRYLPSAERFAERQNRRLTLAKSEDVARWCEQVSTRKRGRGSHCSNC